MSHQYSAQHWADYMEGSLTPKQRSEMERHLQTCDECARFYRKMAEIEDKLKLAAKRQRDVLVISEDRARRAAEACILRMRKPNAPISSAVQKRLTTLENFMSPIWGSETTMRAMRAAAKQIEVASPEVVGEVLWPDFLENLSSVAGMLCGEPAANLVLEVGSMAS